MDSFTEVLFAKDPFWKETSRGVHLTRFWSGTCHRGFKNIPVPYTNFSKKYIRPYVFHSKILKIGTVSYTKIVKIDTVLYTNIWKIDTLPDGTSPYPGNIYVVHPPGKTSIKTVSNQYNH